MGQTSKTSAYILPPECVVHVADDDDDDCDDDNGQLQRNLPKLKIQKSSPKEVRKWVLVGRRNIRCDPLESPKWVSHA